MRRLASVALALIVLLTMAPVAATGQERGGPPDRLPIPEKASENPRVSSRLSDGEAPGRRSSEGLGPESSVTIEVFPEPGSIDDVIRALREAGGAPTRVGDAVVATVPASEIDQLARREGVRWIQPAARPFAEAITAESVGLVDAFDWHDAGHTGLGVSVGIVDLGFENWQAVRDAGELPGSVHTKNFCFDFEEDPHGTAVAEIVHDMAPDARLHLICIRTPADLLSAVDYAEEEGITILTHSVGWFNTGPGNGTGQMSSVISAAAAAGITWINSSGNYAQNHWGGPFSDTDANQYLNFDGADETINFSVSGTGWIDIGLKWNSWPTTSINFDLFLFRDDGGGTLTPVSDSRNLQTGTQPPTEWIEYFHPGESATYHVAIWHESGLSGPSPELDLFVLGPGPIQYFVEARSLNDLAGAPGVVAVGATHNGAIETYSSQGPNIDGQQKPDLSAPVRVSTASYGNGAFAGTSAAAPSAAGVAALLRGTNRCAAANAVAANLESSVQSPPGPDNAYGNGILLLGNPPADQTFFRLEGRDRYRTAEAISKRSNPCGARVVYIATGLNFPDALAGGATAAEENAPVLLVLTDKVPNATIEELQRLDPDLIVVLGGAGAISDATLSSIAALVPGATIERRWGPNRYDTAAQLSKAVYGAGVETVYVTTGENFYNALITAPSSVATFSPMILTRYSGLRTANRAELQRLDPDEIVIVGNTTDVPNSVRDELDTIAPTRRISGSDRYQLAVNISKDTWPNGARTVYIARGDLYPDALAGGALTRTANGPLLLVQPTSLPSVVAAELDRLNPTRIVILGGPGAVSESVANQIKAYQQ